MIVLAHLLPLLFGLALFAAVVERPRFAGAWLRGLGYGYLLGLAAVVAMMILLRPAPTSAFGVVSGSLLVLLVPILVSVQRRWLDPVPSPLPAAAMEPDTRTRDCWFIAAFIVWLVWRGWILGAEVSLRTVFPWDAWTTWSVIAKTWFLNDAWLDFAPLRDWLSDPERRYLAAWTYPKAVPLLQVWFASASGTWDEPSQLLLWPTLWLAGLAVLLGQLRAWAVPWPGAVLAALAWGSLPLVQTHVALAGYADLPLTVAFAAAALALARYASGHGRRWLTLAIALALALPGIKQEGALWLGILMIGVLYTQLPGPHRLKWIVFAGLVLALTVIGLGVPVPVPGLGWVEVGWSYLRAPAAGLDLQLSWRPVASQIAGSLFLAPNWHLLWWFSPLILLTTVPVWRRHAALGLALALGMLTVLVMFFLTDAAAWAQDLTAVNRVLMQLSLAWVAWLALLVNDALIDAATPASIDTHRSTARQPDPDDSGSGNAAGR